MARPPAIETETALWLALDVSSLKLTDDQLIRLFRDNEEYQFELSAKGELIIMSPANNKTSIRTTRIIARLANWAALGIVPQCEVPVEWRLRYSQPCSSD